MSKVWLVLDVHYLCHRAFHSTASLTWKEKPTGVIFGFLKSIAFLKDEFQTDRVLFCFEHSHLYRRDVYPDYKRKRMEKVWTPEEQRSFQDFAFQISELRQRYLPKIGFRNVFRFQGMESDDIMAALAKGIPKQDDVILVTADSDMLQCLSANVSMYSPQKRKLITAHSFEKQYGVSPTRWALVKAIAGCKGDGVTGIKGIGEITALKYVRKELDPQSKAFGAIRSEQGRATVRRNRQLVELPYAGCPMPKLEEDCITKEKWLDVMGSLGMRSLAAKPPIASRKMFAYGQRS